MKTFFIALLLLSTSAHASGALSAPLLSRVLQKVRQGAHYRPLGHGLAFGDNSIESCAFAARDVLVLVSYCYPAKDYPARALTISSPALGEVELYFQDMGGGRFKYDVRLNQFPEAVRGVYPADFRTLDFAGMRALGEKLYNSFNPACWSTNFDYGTGKFTEGCVKAELASFPLWERDARVAVEGPEWERVYAAVLKAVQK
jgi:hypothetical protein